MLQKVSSLKPTLQWQKPSEEIWKDKYRLKDQASNAIDQTPEDTYARVALALASVEKPADRNKYYDIFLWAIENGALPAGRILANAGALSYKPATSVINCTVSGSIEDSMESIMEKALEASLTLKAGCGIGYEFSTLRPKGAYVSGAGAYTSGPLSFMEIYDKMCFTVRSAGGRRGAQMATFDINHPNVMDYISAKREAGCLRQFNLSLLITADFMEAVKNNQEWKLNFPLNKEDVEQKDLNDPQEVIWRRYPMDSKRYLTNAQGDTACRVYKTIPARRLWNMIMSSNYDFGDPGFILIDRVNELNNNWWVEDIRATNPCGEQPLPPYGSCLLGSINLTKFVKEPFSDKAKFDWQTFNEVVRVFTRMLDNVVEINGLPLSEQRDEIQYKRRHGMGFLGLGSAMNMLGMTYGNPASLEFTESVAREMAITGWKQALELSKEKGPAPIMNDEFKVTAKMLAMRPEMAEDYKVGDKVSGRILHACYSRYMQKIAKEEPELVKQLAQYGARYTHHTSIAPTGTIASSLANNVSNGIEPSYAHAYSRNVICEGYNAKQEYKMLSYELLAYRHLVNPNASPDATNAEDRLPSHFVTAQDITPKQHIDVQAAAQKWVDSSISKTANVPIDCDFDEFKEIYLYAYSKGVKGCTTFRTNPELQQNVLVTEKDLENTLYEFDLSDGSKVTFKGNDKVEYEGEINTAANLYGALKEGWYGKL